MKQRKDLSQTPYYRCLVCPRFRTLCGGRPTRDMDLLSWCEYICDVMTHFGLTIAYVAKEAEVSEKRVEQIHFTYSVWKRENTYTCLQGYFTVSDA